jgi:hypothetical protein
MIMTRIFAALLGMIMLTSLSGCTWVKLKPQGERVRILTPAEITQCKYLGRVTSNTAATIGFIARGRSTIQEEVYRLARNNAGDMGGDTIVPTGPLIEGEQTFNIYRCINP